MSNQLRALVGLTYPSPESLEMVKRAGGISKLSNRQKSKLVLIERKPGQFCNDLPTSSLKDQLKRGNVEIVGESKTTKAAGRTK